MNAEAAANAALSLNAVAAIHCHAKHQLMPNQSPLLRRTSRREAEQAREFEQQQRRRGEVRFYTDDEIVACAEEMGRKAARMGQQPEGGWEGR